jgi:hypothetical protein
MSPCVDYRRHELECSHRKEYRWRAADGCSGHVCVDCLKAVMTWPVDDQVRAVPVDDDGIPLDRGVWTNGDHVGHMIRTTEREPRQ